MADFSIQPVRVSKEVVYKTFTLVDGETLNNGDLVCLVRSPIANILASDTSIKPQVTKYVNGNEENIVGIYHNDMVPTVTGSCDIKVMVRGTVVIGKPISSRFPLNPGQSVVFGTQDPSIPFVSGTLYVTNWHQALHGKTSYYGYPVVITQPSDDVQQLHLSFGGVE